MIEKKIICTVCPMGCEIYARGDADRALEIAGNQCKRGELHARNEFAHPLRILTSTVKVAGGTTPLVAVRSNQPIPREKLFECMKLIKHTRLNAPVKLHQVIIPDILGTNADIIATGTVEQR